MSDLLKEQKSPLLDTSCCLMSFKLLYLFIYTLVLVVNKLYIRYAVLLAQKMRNDCVAVKCIPVSSWV